MFLDEFGKYLWAHAPGVCVILSIIIAVVVLCWKVFRLYGRLEKVEETCNDIGSIKKDISKISADLGKLFVYLSSSSKDFPKDFFVSNSPIQLNTVGIELLEVTGGKKFIDDTLTDLIKTLHENNEFKSALDVQNAAVSLLYSFTDLDGFTPIKNYIFNNPVYKSGESEFTFTISIAINIMAIYLRDKYFELYPELKDVEQPEAHS